MTQQSPFASMSGPQKKVIHFDINDVFPDYKCGCSGCVNFGGPENLPPRWMGTELDADGPICHAGTRSSRLKSFPFKNKPKCHKS